MKKVGTPVTFEWGIKHLIEQNKKKNNQNTKKIFESENFIYNR